MDTDIEIKLETEAGTKTEASMKTRKLTRKRVQKPQEGFLHPGWTPKGTKKGAKKDTKTKSRINSAVSKQKIYPDIAIQAPVTEQPSTK